MAGKTIRVTNATGTSVRTFQTVGSLEEWRVEASPEITQDNTLTRAEFETALRRVSRRVDVSEPFEAPTKTSE